ncbi:PAS domain S-box protein, partial [archaeon]|nr:PAS domain S-box protein [archaeon]
MSENPDKQIRDIRETLRKSEEKYRTILESIEEGYYEVDLKGNFTFCNGSLCRILEASREELMGMSYSSFVDDNTAGLIFSTFNNVLNTGRDLETAEWEFTRKGDKHRIFIEVSISRILSQEGRCKGFRGIVRDVTHRVTAEKALMESEQRYRLLAENVNDIIWMADLSFNFTYVSPSVKRVARATTEDTLKLNIRHVMSHEMFTKVKEDFRSILVEIGRGDDCRDRVK